MLVTNPNNGLMLLLGVGSIFEYAMGHGIWSSQMRHAAFDRRGIANITHSANADSVTSVGFPMFPNGTLSGLGLTAACEESLYQNVTCDASTSSLMTTTDYVGEFDNSTETSLVCQSSCESSIAQLYANVSANCGQSALVNGLPFVGLIDTFWCNWNQSCFVDPTTGDNCNDVISAFPNVTSLSDLPTADLCSYCYVQKLQMMQANAYSSAYDSNWQTTYEYVASTCNVTVSDFNATASAFNVTIPVSTPNCISGNTYTTTAGDTCDSIAVANSISAATMFYINPNILNCSGIPTDTTLCLPQACNNIYNVQENDTCVSIAVDAGIFTSELLAYNSQLNWNCTNLVDPDPYWGTTLCVSNPGGNYTGQALNTTTSTTMVHPPSNASVPSGTTLDCGAWYLNDGSLTCAQICLAYLVSIDSFTEANPSLNKTTCDEDLILGDAYCVDPLSGWQWSNVTGTGTIPQRTATSTSVSSTSTVSISTTSITPPGATMSGIPSNCDEYYVAQTNDTCATVEALYDITSAQFLDWNPAVSSDCSTNFWVGEAYCVGVSGTTTATTTASATASSVTPPAATMSGIPSNCNQYYVVQTGDSCASVESEFDITSTEFFKWNPSVSNDCETNFWVGEAYCVGVSGSTTTATTSSTPSTASTSLVPGPTMSGIPSNCNEYYVVQTGDTCDSVEAEFGITSTEFFDWNPSVSTDCETNFWVGEAYCVGIA